MDPDEGMNSVASLKQSIRDSEASLRQMKQTIRVVDARLKQQSHADTNKPRSAKMERSYLNAAAGGGWLIANQ
jgi:hypothetical protein